MPGPPPPPKRSTSASPKRSSGAPQAPARRSSASPTRRVSRGTRRKNSGKKDALRAQIAAARLAAQTSGGGPPPPPARGQSATTPPSPPRRRKSTKPKLASAEATKSPPKLSPRRSSGSPRGLKKKVLKRTSSKPKQEKSNSARTGDRSVRPPTPRRSPSSTSRKSPNKKASLKDKLLRRLSSSPKRKQSERDTKSADGDGNNTSTPHENPSIISMDSFSDLDEVEQINMDDDSGDEKVSNGDSTIVVMSMDDDSDEINRASVPTPEVGDEGKSSEKLEQGNTAKEEKSPSTASKKGPRSTRARRSAAKSTTSKGSNLLKMRKQQLMEPSEQDNDSQDAVLPPPPKSTEDNSGSELPSTVPRTKTVKRRKRVRRRIKKMVKQPRTETVYEIADRYNDQNEMLAKAKVVLPEWTPQALLQYRQAGWSLKQLVEYRQSQDPSWKPDMSCFAVTKTTMVDAEISCSESASEEEEVEVPVDDAADSPESGEKVGREDSVQSDATRADGTTAAVNDQRTTADGAAGDNGANAAIEAVVSDEEGPPPPPPSRSRPVPEMPTDDSNPTAQVPATDNTVANNENPADDSDDDEAPPPPPPKRGNADMNTESLLAVDDDSDNSDTVSSTSSPSASDSDSDLDDMLSNMMVPGRPLQKPKPRKKKTQQKDKPASTTKESQPNTQPEQPTIEQASATASDVDTCDDPESPSLDSTAVLPFTPDQPEGQRPVHYDEVEPCFVDEVSRSAVKYFCESFGLLGDKTETKDAAAETRMAVGHVDDLLKNEMQRLKKRRQSIHALLNLASCTAQQLYDTLFKAFEKRKFFLSFDTFSETLETHFNLTESAIKRSSNDIRNVIVDAFEAFDCFGTEFVTLIDLQLVLLSPAKQKEFHKTLRSVDVRQLNQGLSQSEQEALQEQELPEGSATLFYHLLQRYRDDQAVMTREDFSDALNGFCDTPDKTDAWVELSRVFVWQVFAAVDFMRTGAISADELKLWYERGADSWTDEALLNGLDVSTDPVRDFRKETYAFFEKSSDQTSERWENEQERLRGLAKYWLVLDAKRSAHIKAASIVQKSAVLQESQKHLEDRAKELSDIMATVLAKYDEAVAHQQLMDADDQAEELEEDKPLPEFTTKRFDPNEERFDPALDLTSLFRVRQSPHTQRKALHKKAGSSVEYVQILLRMFVKAYRDKGDPTKELLLRLASLDRRWCSLKQLPRRFYIESSRLASEADDQLTPVHYIFETPKNTRTIWLSVEYAEDKPMDPSDRRLSKCRHIVMEIKSTEKTFVGQLSQLLELDRSQEPFLVMCQEQEPAFKKIFQTVLHVYTLNSGLLKDLEEMKVVHEEVGNIFDKVAPFLKIYVEYIKVFDTCNVFLSRMRGIPDELKIQKQLMASLLITPVQRIPRYRLLLQELYGCTPIQHGRASIQAALDKVTVSADHVNAMLRRVQDSIESAKVFERFKHCGALPPNSQRKLLKEEVLKKIDRNCQPRMRKFFIFDDGLAYGNSSTPTGDTDVHLYFPFESAIKVSPLDKYALETNEIKYNFRIETALKSFDVEAADEKERNDWIMAITDARTKFRQKSNPAAADGTSAASKWRKGYNKLRLMLRKPVATADSSGVDPNSLEEKEVMAPVLASRKDCAVCGIIFSFLHQNRHKMKFCKSCGEGVCHVCSLHKIPLINSRPEEAAVAAGARPSAAAQAAAARAAVAEAENGPTMNTALKVMGAASKFKKLLRNSEGGKTSPAAVESSPSASETSSSKEASPRLIRARSVSGTDEDKKTDETQYPARRRSRSIIGRAAMKKPTDEQRVCDNCFIRYKRQQPAATILWTYFDDETCIFQHLDASVNERLENHYMWSRPFTWSDSNDSYEIRPPYKEQVNTARTKKWFLQRNGRVPTWPPENSMAQ